jgi:adenylate kinase family enzyme
MKNKIKSTLSSFLISSLMLNPQISKGDSLEEKLTKNKDQTELPKEFIEKSSKNQIFL